MGQRRRAARRGAALGITIVAALALLGACSDDDDAGDATTTVATSAEASTSTTSASSSTTSGASSTAPATTAGPALPTTTSPTTPPPADDPYVASPDFCAALGQLQDQGDIVGQAFGGDSTPTLARTAWEKLDAVLTRLDNEPPQLVAADVATIRESYAGLRAVFEQFGYDTQAMFSAAAKDAALAERLELDRDPTFAGARQRLVLFAARACDR